MLKRFQRDESGHFALMMALGLSVVMMAVGVAVDTAGMVSQKQRLQSAVDGATLASAVVGTDMGEVKKVVKDSVAANLSGLDIDQINTDVKTVDGHLRVSIDYDYEPMLMGMFSEKKRKITAVAEVPMGGVVPLEIAFALDTTESMSGPDAAGGTKLQALQNSAVGMIDMLEGKAGDDLRVSVVPFSNYVNVGTDANIRAKDWLDISNAEGTTSGQSCQTRQLVRGNQCYDTTSTYYDDFGVEQTSTSNYCPDSAYDPLPTPICTTTTSTKVWSGCVGSRSDDLGLTTAADSMSKITGVGNKQCAPQLLPMTGDIDSVKTTIQGLTTSEKTYIPAGLIWAWRMLDPSAPFPNTSSKPRTLRAVVLMTDGNISMYKSQNPSHPHEHRTADLSKTYDVEQVGTAYTRMDEICTRIKNEGIQLYTIGFALDPADTETRDALSSCASSPGFNFNPENAVQLDSTFDAIGASLAEVRLAR